MGILEFADRHPALTFFALLALSVFAYDVTMAAISAIRNRHCKGCSCTRR